MRFLILNLVLLTACEKTNPNLCCVDAADCAAIGLETERPCKDGKACRGNVCVEEKCSTAAECNLTAPFCGDGLCQEMCSDDVQCPGFMQPPEASFCVNSECVECRDAGDCGGTRPTCNGGTCVACTTHDECATGVCASDGACAIESSIAYVDLLGGPTTDCTRTSPCSTIQRALSLAPARPYVLVRTGRYAATGPVSITSSRWLIGSGTPKPVLDRDDDGPVVLVEGALTLRIENLEISGGTGDPSNAPVNAGSGLYCRRSFGSPTIALRDVTARANSYTGIRSLNCTLDVSRSVFTQNGIGALLQDSTAAIDRSVFTLNGNGMNLDGGLFTVTNNFVFRNSGTGIDLYSTVAGNKVEFNTVVDNATSATNSGINCNLDVGTAFPNNIIARNGSATAGMNCSFPGSIIADTDVSALKFKQPDATPYDYHLQAGSMAIDMAAISTLDHDFDGDARPKGAGRDVGADEAQ